VAVSFRLAHLAAERSRSLTGSLQAVDNTWLGDAIFELGPHVRYVAFGSGQDVELLHREGLANASDAGSDFFEELLVNPTLLTLARQRGELDCGGLRWILIGYGNFVEVVVPAADGHISVAIELGADPVAVAGQVVALVTDRRRAAPA
jgi:hypothetical protein